MALLATLWLVVALGGLTAGVLGGARVSLGRSQARMAKVRGHWAAEGCLAATIGQMEERLRTERRFSALEPAPVIAFSSGATCTVEFSDPTATPHSPYATGQWNANGAPDSILLSLPGMTSDAVRALAEARAWGRPIGSLNELSRRLPGSARAELDAHFVELLPILTFAPGTMVLTSRGIVPGQSGTAIVELHVGQAGARVAVLHRRVV